MNLVVQGSEVLDWYDRVLLGKASKRPSILTDAGLLRQILHEAEALRSEVGKVLSDRALKSRLKKSLDIDWGKRTDAEKTEAVNEVANVLDGLPSKFIPGVEVVLDREGGRVVRETKKATKAKHPRLSVDAAFLDEREDDAVEALKTTTTVFFRRDYERRTHKMRDRGKRVIADGLRRGLGRKEISGDLAEEFDDLAVAKGYWETVAALHVTRARSFASAKTYAEAGVEKYEILAILDERTTDQCIWLSGRVFSVKRALEQFDSMEGAKPAELVTISPLLRVSGDSIVLPSGKKLATRTDRGGWEDLVKDPQDHGVSMPPFHFRCRSSCIPYFD